MKTKKVVIQKMTDENPFDISNVVDASIALEDELKKKVNELGSKRVPLYRMLLRGSKLRSNILSIKLNIMNKILSIYRARR